MNAHSGDWLRRPVGDAWLAALIRHPAFATLETLDLAWMPFSWRALAGLFNAAADAGIERLTVSPDPDTTLFGRYLRSARAPHRLAAFDVRFLGSQAKVLARALATHRGRYAPGLTQRWLGHRRLMARTFGEWPVD